MAHFVRQGIVLLAFGFAAQRAAALGSGAPFAAPKPRPIAFAVAASGARPGTSAEDDANESATPAGGLSGLRLGAQRSALIDGQWLHTGQSVRGARLIDIGPQGASLRHTDGRIEILSLSPAVQLATRNAARSNATTKANPR